MKIAQEEIFGPVLCVIPFDSDDEAIKIANDSIYGLGGGVWSKNLDRAHSVAAAMRTGTVWVNDYHMITPGQPFGGYKQSGIGRELGDYGYNEYRQIKHVWQNTGHRPQRLPPLRRAQRQHLICARNRYGRGRSDRRAVARTTGGASSSSRSGPVAVSRPRRSCTRTSGPAPTTSGSARSGAWRCSRPPTSATCTRATTASSIDVDDGLMAESMSIETEYGCRFVLRGEDRSPGSMEPPGAAAPGSMDASESCDVPEAVSALRSRGPPASCPRRFARVRMR